MNLAEDIARATLDFDPERGLARLCFAGDEVFFQGHFPERPVLPAVVQVAAALGFAEKMAGRPLRLVEVTRAKFTSPTGPGHELTLSVKVDDGGQGRLRVKAALRDGQAEVSELVIRAI